MLNKTTDLLFETSEKKTHSLSFILSRVFLMERKKTCHTLKNPPPKKTAVNKIIHFFSISKKEKWIQLLVSTRPVFSFVGCNRILSRFNTMAYEMGWHSTIEGNIVSLFMRFRCSNVHWYSCMQLDKNEIAMMISNEIIEFWFTKLQLNLFVSFNCSV